MQEKHGGPLKLILLPRKLQSPRPPTLESCREGSVLPHLHGFMQFLLHVANLLVALDPSAECASNAAINPERKATPGSEPFILLINNEADPRAPRPSVREILEVREGPLHDFSMFLAFEKEFDPPRKGRAKGGMRPIRQCFPAVGCLCYVVLPGVEGSCKTH